MTRMQMTCWIVAVVLLAAATTSAETFHSQAGVVFEGTLRKVVPQATVCNVLEEKYTPDEYERLKGNQGQPLDLWQVDWVVRNADGSIGGSPYVDGKRQGRWIVRYPSGRTATRAYVNGRIQPQ